jgi:hypothetical protein
MPLDKIRETRKAARILYVLYTNPVINGKIPEIGG